MKLPWRSIRLLQRAVHLWLFGYLLSTLPGAERLWLHPAVQPLPTPPGGLAPLTHAFGMWLPVGFAWVAVLIVMVLALRSVVRPSRWWLTAVEWVLFSSLVNLTWLGSTGGHQLIANVLFWMIFLPSEETDVPGAAVPPVRVLHVAAFWIIRLQLLLAYAVTGIQKLAGGHWLAGDAVGIVATDAAYGPAWLAGMPWLAAVVNYGALLFQLTFPLAVWWRPTRHWWMAMGVVFHLATGLVFDIVDMGLAFLVVYPAWFRTGEELQRSPSLAVQR
ncbi:MAG: HTTM domain-containing protein [Flavobacteriales bacterium]|nr:HTTM domain-containing protein [Flavobacteriales bacterium]